MAKAVNPDQDRASVASAGSDPQGEEPQVLYLIGPWSQDAVKAFKESPYSKLPQVSAIMADQHSGGISQDQLPSKSKIFSYAIFDGHGEDVERNKKDAQGKSITTTTINIIAGVNDTVDALLKVTSRHYDIVGCHEGATIHALINRANEFLEVTTFTIPAPGKHTIYGNVVSIPYVDSKLADYTSGAPLTATSSAAKTAKSFAETVFHAVIRKDQFGNNKLYAFKIRAPKTLEGVKEIENNGGERYFATHANENDSKEIRNEACIIGYGDPEDQNYIAVLNQLKADLAATELAPNYKDNALVLAASKNHDPEVITAWIEGGANPNLADNEGFTPLHRAADKGHAEAVKTLLANGALPNSQKDSYTPLYYAAREGYTGAVKELLAHGADPNIPNKNGSTPLYMAVLGGGYVDTIEALLAKEANINVRNKDDSTPLHTAAAGGHLGAIKVLLAKGADPTLEDNNGSTPLSKVTGVHKEEIEQLLQAKMTEFAAQKAIPQDSNLGGSDAAEAPSKDASAQAQGNNPNAPQDSRPHAHNSELKAAADEIAVGLGGSVASVGESSNPEVVAQPTPKVQSTVATLSFVKR